MFDKLELSNARLIMNGEQREIKDIKFVDSLSDKFKDAADNMKHIADSFDSFTFAVKEATANLQEKLLNAGYKPLPDSYSFYMPVYVQRRKHKKKRINKKWAKRYGYKTVNKEFLCKIGNIKCNKISDDSFEITGELQ